MVGKRRLMYAYYLLMENDKDKAYHELKRFEKYIKSYPIKGTIDLELELINYINEKSLEKIAE